METSFKDQFIFKHCCTWTQCYTGAGSNPSCLWAPWTPSRHFRACLSDIQIGSSGNRITRRANENTLSQQAERCGSEFSPARIQGCFTPKFGDRWAFRAATKCRFLHEYPGFFWSVRMGRVSSLDSWPSSWQAFSGINPARYCLRPAFSTVICIANKYACCLVLQ